MHYRRLNERELEQFLHERAAFQTWQAYLAYATDVYGPRAARVEVVADWLYNDETHFRGIESVGVFDAAGDALQPDLTTDWWQGQLTEQIVDLLRSRYGTTIDPVEYTIHQRQAALPVLGVGRAVYTADQPPQRRHAWVYVPADDTVKKEQ
jgi:hypothetical protein